jgi:ABC-type transport system substrate-binding protein
MTTGPLSPTGSPHPPGDPVPASPRLSAGVVAESGACFDLTAQGGSKRMRTARGFQAACLTIALALVAVGCAGPQRDADGDGVRGGTLLVLSADPHYTLDTAVFPKPAIARAYARTLYSYNLAGPPEQQTVPVPDIASGPAQLSPDRRTYTFRLRAGVRYAPKVNREVTATDFITAIQRLYDKESPSYAQQYADLISGAKAFGAGKATRISGLSAPDPHTLKITLDQPAGDFLSILTLPEFAPVPGEYAAHYQVGDNYAGHVVGSGPYTVDVYIPRRTIVLDRNPNWDPATDPLRKAWVDHIQVNFGVPIPSIQQAIEREDADLSLTSHVPQTRIAALRADPERSRRLSVSPTGSLLYLVLDTNPKAGAIADVRVRRAVNYAIDKVAYRDAIADRYAAAGQLASTILAPGSLGYHPYDLYPTPGGRGDPAKAKALLAQAGYPHGLTLGFATLSSRLAAGTKPIEESLKKAGIKLKVTTHREWDPHFEALGNPAKRLEHQLAQSGWIPDYLGDNARQSIVPQYDSRLPLVASGNFSEYHNPKVNRLIDRALAEPDPNRRAALWGQLDQRIMRDAPMVPLVWENYSFQWASRVHGWRYDPWTTGPDLTAVWLDPPSP